MRNHGLGDLSSLSTVFLFRSTTLPFLLYMCITLSKMLQCSLCAKLTIRDVFVAVPTENAEQPRECKFR